MALSTLEINTVSRSLDSAKLITDKLKPVLDAIDVIYNGANGAKTTIDQAGLDAVPSFGGLTKAELDDGVYALTTIKNDIATAFNALTQLSARGS